MRHDPNEGRPGRLAESASAPPARGSEGWDERLGPRIPDEGCGVTVWPFVLAAAGGLVAVWAAFLVALYVVARREDDQSRFRDLLRLAPNVLRLFRGLASDPQLPRGVKWRLGGVLAYLLLPIDLVPDFIPVIGYADDAVVVALGLRWVVRAVGPDALDRHWTGTPSGLALIKRVAGLRTNE
jgi:uncharacterized membrane protein YkvA (DUF1232 family)